MCRPGRVARAVLSHRLGLAGPANRKAAIEAVRYRGGQLWQGFIHPVDSRIRRFSRPSLDGSIFFFNNEPQFL